MCVRGDSHLGFQQFAQLWRKAWIAKRLQRLRLDLANSFAGKREFPADFLQGVLALETDSEPHSEDFFFVRREPV